MPPVAGGPPVNVTACAGLVVTRLPAVQPSVCGPLYRRNVTVPAPPPDVTGLTRPLIVAVSPIDPPTAPSVACVLIAGWFGASVLVSLAA